MKTKKGFTLIELIVVIAILGILALFLVPSFMGYARDAKLEVMKANVRTGQSAYAYALTKYEDEKNEVTQKKSIGEEVCKNMNGIACYYFVKNDLPEKITKYPSMVFSMGEKQNMEGGSISYYLDEKNSCSYIYAYDGYKDLWSCSVNGTYIQTEEEK
ncbi:type II secretion system protein [Dielma fastidiosa]|uniref:type II secretion system protein n=1 Tax=Dielma fastidiosa TaxID=1034346 RepID=UPI00356B6156